MFTKQEPEKDDNNNEMPVHQKVITCSYLEIIKILKRVPSITLKNIKTMRYSVQPGDQIFVKGHGFLLFGKSIGENIGKNKRKT